MKGKFRILGRAGLALFLACTLALVMVPAAVAAPDVSNVWVQLSSYLDAGTGVTYSIYFTPGAALTKDTDTISVIFPADTGVSGAGATVYPDGDLVATPDGTAAATPSTGGTRVVVTTPVAISAGVQVRVDITGITNPDVTADTGKTLQLYTSQEGTKVTSMGYTIEVSSVHPVINVDLTPTQDAAGATAEYIAGFTTSGSGALTSDWGKVTVIFPPEVTLPASMLASDVAFDGDGSSYIDLTVAPVISGRFVTITVSEALANSTAGLVKFKQSAGIQNPTKAASGAYVGKVYTSVDTSIVDDSSGYTIAAASIAKLVFVTADSDAVVGVDAVADLKVQTQDQYGNVANVGADVTIALSSTSTTGLFDGDEDTTFDDPTDTISSGANSCTFDYKDSAAGSFTITVAESPSMDWMDATWDITVEAVHVVSLYDSNDVLIDAYTIIQDAIDDAMAGDTIKVGPGTYTEELRIVTPDLTIESTAGRDSTTIYNTGYFLLEIVEVDDVTIDGFTFEGTGLPAGDRRAIFVRGASGFTIQNNKFIGFNSDGIAVISTGYAITSGIIDSNTFTGMGLDSLAGRSGILVQSYDSHAISGVEITNNILSAFSGDETNAIGVAEVSGAVSAITVQDNIISDSYRGISLWGDVTGLTGTKAISNNTITGCLAGFKASGDTAVAFDLVNNTITGNTLYGVWLHDATPAAQTVTIKYNDLSGNGEWGIYNIWGTSDYDVVATHNWWGDATGPSAGTGTYASTAVGSGTAVSVEVDYSPWLDAADGDPLATTDITLETGWNLISLPLLPTDSSIATVLAGADVTVNKVAYFTGGPAGGWLSWSPPPAPSNLTQMNDGKGYWIDVSAGGSLTVVGVELALPGQAPPTYDVVVGWNLIGFTSLATDLAVEDYLGAVMGTVQAMYEFNASTGLYAAIVLTDTLTPGDGYWLAVNAAGKIYP